MKRPPVKQKVSHTGGIDFSNLVLRMNHSRDGIQTL